MSQRDKQVVDTLLIALPDLATELQIATELFNLLLRDGRLREEVLKKFLALKKNKELFAPFAQYNDPKLYEVMENVQIALIAGFFVGMNYSIEALNKKE